MVFFHPHKCCFQVCLRITVPVFPHDLKTAFIFHQAAAAFFQFLMELLDLRLFLSFPVYKYNPFSCRDQQQVLLEFQDLKWRTVVDLNSKLLLKYKLC